MLPRLTPSLALLVSVSLLSACAVGPDYQRPTVTMPTTFKEAKDWKVAEPQAVNADPAWWSYFNDPVLDQLEREVTVSNQTILQAEAAYHFATAVSDAANAALFPTASANFSATRVKQTTSANAFNNAHSIIANDFNVNGSTSWTIDIWGKLRRSLEAAQDTADQNADLLAGARLSAQAALASNYFNLRSADELERLLDTEVAAFERALTIINNQYHGGTQAKSAVDSEITLLENTRQQALAARVTRAQAEHAIAALLGKAPADFSLAPVDSLAPAPALPISLPSALLERRPDIAAAERQMASANAQIGVAIAAYYPDLTLSGTDQNISNMIGILLHATNNTWSFGPALSETIIDWGARDAQVAQARATYDEQIANYRQTVLTALQQVEDDLVSIVQLDREAIVEDRAVSAAVEGEKLALNEYLSGIVDYTTVVTAQNSALQTKQTALTIHQTQLTTAVSLLQALGGGWQVPENRVKEGEGAPWPKLVSPFPSF